MRKITDKDYSLPVIEALSPYESFETGANKPLLIRGVDRRGNKGDYVVKIRGAGRMSVEASMRELLAAFIAAQMEVRVVHPVIEPRETDLQWINRHCLLSKIRSKAYDFDGFSSRFDNLDEKFWITARKLIPNEWLSDQFDRIKHYFSAICNNKEAFIIELKKMMS